jgi:hypothetical protein
MTPTLFREAGEALFGPRWMSEMARALDISDRTVRRWDEGSYPVPAGVLADVRALLKSRGMAMASVRRKLPRA